MLIRVLLSLALAFGLMGQSQPQTVATPQGFEAVDLQSTGAGGATIKGYIRRPPGTTPAPAVIMLHGCGGIFNQRGNLTARERDWIDRFAAAGYAVMLPDSFNPRGFRQVCTLKSSERTIRPQDRAADSAAAATWLSTQPLIDPQRIAAVGWSHGGSTTLWATAKGSLAASKLRTAIAFYPGCRVPLESATWQPGVPLSILIGEADDWTPPRTCRELVKRHPAIRYIEYPGAVHGFDAPSTPLRTRTDVGMTPTGTAKVGTDPKARAAAIEEVMGLLAEAFK